LEPNSSLAPLTSIVEKKNTMEVSDAKVPDVHSKYLPLCSAMKETHTGLQQLEGE